MAKFKPPTLEHDKVLAQLAKSTKQALTALANVTKAATKKQAVVTPQEIDDTINVAADQWPN